MRNEIVYVELKSGHTDNGPAWIGKAEYSKSGRTIYFNGRAFRSIGGAGISGNYMDVESHEEFWISGVKRNQEDRHWAGSGKILVDRNAMEEYLQLIGQKELDARRFVVVEIDNNFKAVKERIRRHENLELES